METADIQVGVDLVGIGGPLATAVTDLLEVVMPSCIETESHAGLGGGQVTVYRAVNRERWSTGEKVLWRFVCSLAGSTPVDLNELVGYFGHGLHSARVAHVFAIALGV
jgi:hypothetical protein